MSRQLYAGIGSRLFLDFLARGSFFLINIAVARVIGVVEYGKFVYALALVQMLYSFTELGAHTQFVKELGENRAQPARVLQSYFSLKLGLLFVFFLTFALITFPFWAEGSGWTLLGALVWMLANSMLDFNQFACNGLGRLDLAKENLLLQRAGMISGAVVSLVFFRSAAGAMAGIALGSLVGGFLSTTSLMRAVEIQVRWKGSFSEWARILRLSVPTGIAGALGQAWVRIGVVILGWISTSQIVGEYSTAFRVFETSYLLPAAIFSIGLPHLSGALTTGWVEFKVQLVHVVLLVTAAAVVWVAFLYFGSHWIILYLFGPDFLGAVPLLKLMAWVGGLIFLNYLGSSLMVIAGRQKRHTVHVLLAAILSVCFFALLSPRGAAGMALALLSTEICLFLITLRFLWSWVSNRSSALSVHR